jgi:hypothetical protein
MNSLTNGAQLAMRIGSIPPRNHVRLKIFQIINKFYRPNEASMNENFHLHSIDCFICFLVHTRPIYELTELPERFELPIVSSFNILRERIAKFLDLKIPVNYENDIQSFEFIRLYEIADEQPTVIVHEPSLITLKYEIHGEKKFIFIDFIFI